MKTKAYTTLKNKTKIHSASKLASVAATLAFLATSTFAQNLILNGSFETGPGAYHRYYPGETIVGWTVTRASIDYSPGWQCLDGTVCIDLDGNDGDAGGMAETFPTTPGASYTVTFDLAGNPGHKSPNDYPRIKYMRVAAAGQSRDYSFDTTGHDFTSMGWVRTNWQFTANSSSTTLEFYSLDAVAGAGDGPALDEVVVRANTSPTWTLQPSNHVASAGQGFTFTSLATGFPAPAYQWQFSTNGVNYVNIINATGPNYSLASSSVTNIGYYRVVAANSVGTNISASVSLTFLNINMYAGLNILGPIGANYNVQASPDINGSNWTTLTNVSLPSQPYIYIDYNSPTNTKQFYRAVPQ